jgi:hypothetical protein
MFFLNMTNLIIDTLFQGTEIKYDKGVPCLI